MVLVDKEIKKRILNNELISEGYLEDNVGCISYDLTVDYIIVEENKEKNIYELLPGETIFIKTKEQLNIPEDIMGTIAEKNSRMRQGFKVDGPHYQPGHTTYAFLRVQNVSTNVLVINRGDNIAQIIFEQLISHPEKLYNKSFQNEVDFVGLGKYTKEYEKQMKTYENVKEDIEKVSHNIYSNVLTFMGIIVAIFSLLTINYQAFTSAEIDFKLILTINLSLTLCITVLMGLILIFINKSNNKKFIAAYMIILVVLAAATVALGAGIF